MVQEGAEGTLKSIPTPQFTKWQAFKVGRSNAVQYPSPRIEASGSLGVFLLHLAMLLPTTQYGWLEQIIDVTSPKTDISNLLICHSSNPGQNLEEGSRPNALDFFFRHLETWRTSVSRTEI